MAVFIWIVFLAVLQTVSSLESMTHLSDSAPTTMPTVYLDQHCDATLNVKLPVRVKFSASPEYPKNTPCYFTVVGDARMKIQFEDLGKDTCCGRFALFDGSFIHYPYIGGFQFDATHDSDTPNVTYATSSHSAIIHFHSDKSNQSIGFDLILTPYPSVPVRLVNGTTPSSGRVEVFYQGQWGTICDDDFDEEDAARVVCRMMGFHDPVNATIYHGSHFGVGNGSIILDGLNCTSDNVDIGDCDVGQPLNTPGGCGSGDVAAVDCGQPPIRLVNGPDAHSGTVELWNEKHWSTICDDDFDARDARVICRMLGYPDDAAAVAYQRSHFGRGHGVIRMADLGCHGDEADILDCPGTRWLPANCGHHEDAGVACNASPSTTVTTPMTIPTSHSATIADAVNVSCNEYGWDVAVDMAALRRLYPSAGGADLYLGDNSCTAVETGGILRFRQGLRQCLTSEIVRNSRLFYYNQLVYAQHDPAHPSVVSNYVFTLPIECDVDRNETSIGYIDHGTNTTQPPVTPAPGHSHYHVAIAFYRDSNFLQEIRGYPLNVSVGNSVYVKVFTQTADWTVKMRVHTCYMKPSMAASDTQKQDIIKNGCEVDANTHLISQSNHETRFVFQDFDATSHGQGVYLFCDATFCDTHDLTSACLQTCQP